MNESYRTVRRLRASRNFTAEPISAEDLAAILEAARWTGSSKNNQDWAFVVVEGAAAARLAAAGRFTRAMKSAPLTIALVKLKGGNDFDIGRAAQNIMLAASSLGIGSCPITLHNMDAAAEALSLPKGQEAHYAVALGHVDVAAEDAERRERRAGGWGGRKENVVIRMEE
jgi:nitroreductase